MIHIKQLGTGSMLGTLAKQYGLKFESVPNSIIFKAENIALTLDELYQEKEFIEYELSTKIVVLGDFTQLKLD